MAQVKRLYSKRFEIRSQGTPSMFVGAVASPD